MTADTAPDSPAGNAAGRGPTGGTPKLADRLSALVGQTAVRQDESSSAERLIAAISARVDAAAGELRERIAAVEVSQATGMSTLEALVSERLSAIEAALGGHGGDADEDVKLHVDEVGGALILRLDEVLLGLAEQVDQTRTQVVGQVEEAQRALEEQAETTRTTAQVFRTSLEDARLSLAAQLEDARTQLADQAQESRSSLRTAVESVDATVRGHVGDLAAGVLELGGGPGLTRDDVDAALTDLHTDVRDLPGLFETVAQAAQLDGVTATTTALRDELDAVVRSLATMRTEFAGLQDAIERRVDDAALALAETLVAVVTPQSSAQPAPAITYDHDDYAVPEGGDGDDWAAADEPETLLGTATESELATPARATPAQLDEAALVEESEEQAAGVDEGGIETSNGDFAQPAAYDDSPARRKGIFRR